ncbi:Uncharacterised protein [Klebsiella pneumoniae]|uniref:hypothetical protein n=1 Tax=Klebsiella pneumoniae TaxID=573 RepID=UPI000E2C53E9|nr:hypothetical protein [Klebsiella pneumoniae]QBP28197.1 hypothetical protein [Klebsiella phage ST15-VIM1phi2.1]MDX7469684.1 hypothetical protein [Klebsiella pneumoniae]CAF3269020.1 hypothetical protein AI3024V1_3609 [Klebsiella pneumoniae]CAF3280520.1 hypothetical protein AI3025V1_3616 [Klebsiella pneumoniae]CAH5702108.1 hypothetical protein AI3024V1_3609 [Klebsiella pneumoniae]
MGITLFTNNAFSSVSDPDEYSPGFDVTSLRRAEIFTYTGIGKNLMPGEGGPTVVGTPTFITDSPFVQFSNNANVAHLNLGINDAAQQTWFLLFDPNNDSTQRIIAGSFSGTAASTPPGVSVIVDESGALAVMQGVYYSDSGAYGTARATLSAFDKTKPMLICLTLNGKNTRLTDMTNNIAAAITLAENRERAPARLRIGKGGVTYWGSTSATSRIGAYMVFDRVLSDAEKGSVRDYLLRCIQAKYPSLIF